MTKKVIALKPGDTIATLFKVFKKHNLVGAPVINSAKKIVGVITETDLMRHFTTLPAPRAVNLLGSLVMLENPTSFNKKFKEKATQKVEDLMTSPAITLPEGATLQAAMALMEKKGLNRLPIIGKGSKLSGLLTRKDVFKQLLLLWKH